MGAKAFWHGIDERWVMVVAGERKRGGLEARGWVLERGPTRGCDSSCSSFEGIFSCLRVFSKARWWGASWTRLLCTRAARLHSGFSRAGLVSFFLAGLLPLPLFSF